MSYLILKHAITPFRQGRDPLDACLESGARESSALLIEHFPGVIHRLTQRCSRLVLEQDKLESILLYICQHNLLQCRDILLAMAEMTVIAGQQLLCLSSDYPETTQAFSRYVHALAHIATQLRSVENAKPAFLQIIEGIFGEVLVHLGPLWAGLSEWLTILASEMV